MKERYLEVTFRKGRAVAAYLYLPRSAGVTVARTQEGAPGILVDYDNGGHPVGIELTAPEQIKLDMINQVLRNIGAQSIEPAELAPLKAA